MAGGTQLEVSYCLIPRELRQYPTPEFARPGSRRAKLHMIPYLAPGREANGILCTVLHVSISCSACSTAEGKCPDLVTKAWARHQDLRQGWRREVAPVSAIAQPHHCVYFNPQTLCFQILTPTAVWGTYKCQSQSDSVACNYCSFLRCWQPWGLTGPHSLPTMDHH